jgi:hypothetical protein
MQFGETKRSALAVVFITTTFFPATSGLAQTRSVRDTATAYGARLNAKGQPADANPARINNRIASRIDSRLALRIERYRPEAASDPAAAFRTTTDDKSRTAPVVAPPQQLNIDDDR